ncbi:hypothetical protein BZG04_13505 [Salinivibrio kushneri]|uniref:UPF0149 family protein n=1 Tax=Salinivibrio kushneri TaxID=1908198 RepID=UPI0009890602|nr:UPF0149 family protein [Salinivibrio kushneri]OOE33418.1 hypothetical protein BZG04_13505 [Salinivibrio kushneri]
MTLSDFLTHHADSEQLLNEMQTRGVVTAMAAAPHVISPSEWLPVMWGGEEQAPFENHEQFEQYANLIVDIWNEQRQQLLEKTWQWPEGCLLDDAEIVNQATRDFAEGLLQGWSLTRDDWETLMPENTDGNALLGGVVLSISLLYDPETALSTMEAQGAEELAQFEEIFNAMPTMLCGLTHHGAALAEDAEGA